LIVKFIIINIVAGIDVAILYLCLVECISRSEFCYLHQSRFPSHSLYDIDNIAFVVIVVIVVVVADLSLLDNHVVH
jgi:hypothetical protein